MPTVIWNAIVKDEAARIERCMQSLDGQIDGAIILDTGSSDNTIDLIQTFMQKRNLPCEVAIGKFETWDQARNDALALARRSALQWDYLFLVDADMQLVVTDPKWKSELTGGQSYEVVQKAGTVVYSNSRLVHRATSGLYRGVTHEYLDIPSAGCLKGVFFLDHADGANRTGKALRDAGLLRGGLEKEPQNGRYWYYLGQSLKDAGLSREAIPAFESAIKFSNWDEEQWNARVHLAHCYDDIGDRGGFYREMLDAYDVRPSRAESIYDLAKHFREKGKNHAALLFAEMGLTKSLPGDRLFVNSYPYRVGFKEEYAIAGFYDESRREVARRYNDELSLSLLGEGSTRVCARNNMFHYLRKLGEYCPGALFSKIDFTPPEGWVAMNPSMTQTGVLSVRCVNYTITDWGSYAIRNSKDGSINRDNPINTRNFVRWDGQWLEVIVPEYTPLYDLVIGAEDMRIFMWMGELWSLSNFRDRNSEGACEQHVAKLVPQDGVLKMEHLRKVEPQDFHPSYAEKNWMPWVKDNGKNLNFVYRLGKILDTYGYTVFRQKEALIDVQRLSGGGTPARMRDGRWLVILHEAQFLPGQEHKRYYYHRFATMQDDGTPVALSRPFVFHEKQIEFAAGLAILDDEVWISYGVRDQEPWMARIPLIEVERMFR